MLRVRSQGLCVLLHLMATANPEGLVISTLQLKEQRISHQPT